MNLLLRSLVRNDVPSALELCRTAGWNQCGADWMRLLEYEPGGCFAAEIEDQLVGTVTTTRYGTDLAWIGMMLVHQDFRRRGVGTKLMNTSLDYLREQRVKCIKLDATPAGQPVYERLGFRPEWIFHRFSRDGANPGVNVLKPSIDSLAETILELDREAFGVDRSKWLARLAREAKVCVHQGGYGMLRHGYLANYLGPMVAATESDASEIVDELIDQSTGKIFWDVPHGNGCATELAQSRGFKPVRDLTRMWIGSKVVTPNIRFQYALSDPGTG